VDAGNSDAITLILASGGKIVMTCVLDAPCRLAELPETMA
jgi:hypothetical protein